MSPELVVFAIAIAVIVLIWLAGLRGISYVFQESEKGPQNASSMGLRISLFIFKVVMLFLLVFVLWLGLLIASMRS